MHPDRENRYRPLLEEDPPEFTNKVNNPFVRLPDLEEFNQHASKKIAQLLTRLERRRVKPQDEWASEGLLVLGEPGTGKTHLLMRVARTLSKSNRVLFVPKPMGRDTVAQHIWRSVVESLVRTLPGGDRSQLDGMLARVFCDILVPEFERDIALGKDADKKRRWVEKLRADPHNLFTMLGGGEQRQKNLDYIRTRTLSAVKAAHAKVDPAIARALITYCLVASDADRHHLRTWLHGVELDAAVATRLGLPALLAPLDLSADDRQVGRRREEQALRAIVSVATLSTHHQPLLLAFDQLEGLRGDEELTLAWGDVVREISDQAPNVLIVTCVFPSLWRDWFEPLFQRRPEVKSMAARVAQNRVELEPFAARFGAGLLAGQLAGSFEKHRLPTSVYPFEASDIEEIGRRVASPREYLDEARQRFFEPWLDGDPVPTVTTPEPEPGVTAEQLQRAVVGELVRLHAEYQARKDTWAISDDDFLGRLQSVVKSLLAHTGENAKFDKVAGRGVMPPNFVLRASSGPAAVVAVCHAEGVSFTAQVKNLLAALEVGGQVAGAVLMRYKNCRGPVGVALDHLRKFAVGRGHYLETARVDVALVNALSDVLTAIEEGDLVVGRVPATKTHFAGAVRAWPPAGQSLVFRQIAARFEPLRRALALAMPNAPGAPAKRAP